MTTRPPLERIIRNDADLFALWQTLMGEGGFGRRSLWLCFLDADNRTMPVLVPIDDIPHEPDHRLLANLGLIIAGVVADGSAASVALLLSRPGPPAMDDADRRWAQALRSALPDDIARWPVHLATTDRIQVFAPDDLVGI